MPNQFAAANRRPTFHATMMDNLDIYFASDALFPAVAELAVVDGIFCGVDEHPGSRGAVRGGFSLPAALRLAESFGAMRFTMPVHEPRSSGRASAPSKIEGNVRADSRRLLRFKVTMREFEIVETFHELEHGASLLSKNPAISRSNAPRSVRWPGFCGNLQLGWMLEFGVSYSSASASTSAMCRTRIVARWSIC